MYVISSTGRRKHRGWGERIEGELGGKEYEMRPTEAQTERENDGEK